jgi:uncharacterized protein (DUF1015 family)
MTVCDNQPPSTKVNVTVPDFLPFRGLRYHDLVDCSAVSAPPYDVIDDDERVVLERADRHNAVRLILPREEDGRDRYAVAASLLADWRSAGVLTLDDEASFYAYRMTFVGPDGMLTSTAGVIGALVLPTADDNDEILPHERTLPKARSDRLALLRATRANLDPIWGLSLASGLTAMITGAEPVAHSIDADGTRHELGRITDPEHIAEVRTRIAAAPVVLADGHHRYATARHYRAEQASEGVPDRGTDSVMALIVELADDQLCVQPIHRLLTGGAARVPAELRVWLGGAFVVEAAGPATSGRVQALIEQMDAQGALGLVDRDGLALLQPRSETLAARLAGVPEPLQNVDAARFEVLVDPEERGVELSFRDDAHTVAALVEKGAADAAVLLRPPTIEAIRAVAFAGLRMPPKTTYFAPKPRTGMVVRGLDD